MPRERQLSVNRRVSAPVLDTPVSAPHFPVFDTKEQSANGQAPFAESYSPERLLAHLLLTVAPTAELLGDIRTKLTDREQTVLFAFLTRLRNKNVANRLGTCEQTVRNQISAIRRKLKIASPLELVVKVILALVREQIDRGSLAP